MRLSAIQQEIVRQQPQSTELKLSIFQPQVIFKAQVNAGASPVDVGSRVIPYNNVSTGNYTAIENGFTMWIGSIDGGNDIGKIRVRSATSTNITVSENSNIQWANGQFLTIFRYVELWPIFPRIIQDPNNPENTLWYKDYDIAYSNQNSVLGTFVDAGPHRVAYRDPASGLAQIYYSSTGSYNVKGDALTYAWFFEGATVTGSTSADPGYITYNHSGNFVTRLIITNASGGTDTTYRYVTIDPPDVKWQLNSFSGSRDEGGYKASIRVFETVPLQQNAVVVLYKNSFYGANNVNLGGNYPNASDIFFVGYIDADTISYDYEHSEVSFDAVSITELMKKSFGFSVSVASKLSPAYWYELLDMDGHRALFHYLKWHTTFLLFNDFQFVGDDYKIQFFDSDRQSMYDALNNYMRDTLIGQVVTDRQGKVWAEVQAMVYSNPTGTFTPPVFDISKRDWKNTPNIDERLTPDISYIEYGGVAYSGVNTGTFTPLIGSAPGSAPSFYGQLDWHEGMALLSQSQLNQLVGNIFANKNSPFPKADMDMADNVSNLDIAPQEGVGLHIDPSDTIRNKLIDGLYIPNEMNWKYDPKDKMLSCHVTFNQLVSGFVGETVIIPPATDIGGGFGLPNFETPPLPNIFLPTDPKIGDGAPPKVIVHDNVAGLIFTQTFNTETPVWYQVNAGLTQTQYQGIEKIVICPNGAIYVARMTHDANIFLARAPYVGGVFTVLEDYASVQAKYGGSTNNLGIDAFDCNREVAESVLYVLTEAGSNKKTYLGSGNTFVAKIAFGSFSQRSDVSWGAGNWLHTGDGGTATILSPDASTVVRTASLGGSTVIGRHKRVGLTGRTIHWDDNPLVGTGWALALGTDNVTSLASNVGTGLDSNSLGIDKVECDPTGIYVMCRNNSSNATRSSDGGYSFNQVANLPVLVNWYFYSINASQWIAVSSYIYYTDSFFNTYPYDKRGNILQINPLLSLNAVKVVP